MSSPAPAAGSPPPGPNARRNGLWPEIRDEDSARYAAKQGMVGALVVAGVTALVSFLGTMGFSLWSLLDAAVFVAIGVGIWRMSRAAAVAGLVVFLIERVQMAAAHPDQASKGVVMGVIITIAFINGIRGTFAYHRFTRPAASTAPVQPR